MSQQQTTPPPTTALVLAPIKDEDIETLFAKINGSATILNVVGNLEAIASFGETISMTNLNKFLSLDVSTMTDDTLSAWDKWLEETKGRVSKGIAKQEDTRKPITQKFDAFKSKCTAQELRLFNINTRLQDCRVIIAKAKAALASKALAEQNRELNRSTELVQLKGSFRQFMLNAATGKAGLLIQKMTGDFLNLTNETIELFATNLTNFNTFIPVEEMRVMNTTFTFPWRYHNPSEEVLPTLSTEELAAVEAECNTLFSTAIRQKIDELNNKLPMKRAELKQGVIMTEEDKAQEVAESITFLAGSSQSAITQVAHETIVERVHASGSSAIVVPQQSKGTSKKQVLKPSNNAQWAVVVAAWCAQSLPNLTPEEIEKKIGFMAKYFTTLGNAGGGWPAGVDIVEDFTPTTRGKR